MQHKKHRRETGCLCPSTQSSRDEEDEGRELSHVSLRGFTWKDETHCECFYLQIPGWRQTEVYAGRHLRVKLVVRPAGRPIGESVCLTGECHKRI